MKTKCKIDIREFPFDTQSCEINFGSWVIYYFQMFFILNRNKTKNVPFFKSQDDTRINIILGSENIKTNDYSENSVWKLVNSSVALLKTKQRVPSFLSKYGIKIEEIQFTFNIVRRPLYFMINGIFPCLILNCLTLLFFFLPYTAQISLSKYFDYNFV